jgi:hypothetical protein
MKGVHDRTTCLLLYSSLYEGQGNKWSDVNSIVVSAELNLEVILSSQSRFSFVQTACLIAERASYREVG